MHRPKVNVVDCTIRDGGLMNDSKFDLDIVRAVFNACCRARLDVCELGYRNSKKMFDPAEFGPWRFCDEEDLKRATDGIDRGRTKIAVMMDAHKSSIDDLLPKEDSLVDIVRVATYVKDINQAVRTANAARDLGYETTMNIMAISHAQMPELEACLDQIESETSVSAVYIVDSFGYMYMDQLHFMVAKYQMHLKTKAVGVHFHNNQQLAFANTMEGIVDGATWADGTLYGLGRGAGNCTTELLVSFLKDPDYDLLPILDCVGKQIIPLRKKIEWGYHIPYMITGILNQHPQPAIRQMNLADEEEKHDYVKFYTMVDE